MSHTAGQTDFLVPAASSPWVIVFHFEIYADICVCAIPMTLRVEGFIQVQLDTACCGAER